MSNAPCKKLCSGTVAMSRAQVFLGTNTSVRGIGVIGKFDPVWSIFQNILFSVLFKYDVIKVRYQQDSSLLEQLSYY